MNWFISSKVSPPIRNLSYVHRSRLLHKLDKTLIDHRVSTIIAPAGYGKSVLLTQWYEQLIENGYLTAWITLDKSDNDPVLLLSYLFQAMRQAGLNLGNMETASTQSFFGMPQQTVTGALINVLDSVDQNIIIVLDGFESLLSKAAIDILNQFMKYMPSHVHVTIGSRVVPDIPLANMRAHHELIEIVKEDLQFRSEEIMELFTQSGDFLPTEGLCRSVQEKTEGWIIAIEMLGNIISSESDGISYIDEFSGRTIEIATYLTEQIYLDCSSLEQEVLRRSAITSRFNSDLINLLCDRRDGKQLLSSFLRKALIIPLDRDGEWYRFNSLFAEYLMEVLKKYEPDSISKLHIKAAEWFMSNGLFTEAMIHAWDSGDYSIVANILSKAGGWRLILDGRINLLRSALDLLPQSVIDETPRLKLGQLLMLAKDGRAMTAVDLFNNHFKSKLQYQDDQLLQLEIKIVFAFLAGYGDQPQTDTHISMLEELRTEVSRSDLLLHANIENNLSFAYLQKGVFDASAESARHSLNYYRNIKSTYGEAFLYIHLGAAYLSQGRLRDAEATWREGLNIANTNFGVESDIAILTKVYLAVVHYEWNQIENAEAYLNGALDHIERSDCWTDVYLHAYITASSLSMLFHGPDKSIEMLERGIKLANKRSLQRLDIILAMKIIGVLANSGDTKAALERADILGLKNIYEGESDILPLTRTIREIAGLTLARLYVALNNHKKALSIIEPLSMEIQSYGNTRTLIELLALEAKIQYSNNHRSIATNRITQAITFSVFEGFVRTFLDEGPFMHRLLGLAQRNPRFQGKHDPHKNYLEQLIAASKNEGNLLGRSETSLVLTTRQREILMLLYQGCSNDEVAQRLCISTNTVKFHVKGIYKLLNVRSRKQAMSIAIERKLL